MTKESLMGYLESRGHPWGREILFTQNDATKILGDYEKFGKDIKNILIHCDRGKNRSPAVGIAMNEIYGWGINGLKKRHPEFRKYIYQTIIDVSKTR
jgi:hypothetical protein